MSFTQAKGVDTIWVSAGIPSFDEQSIKATICVDTHVAAKFERDEYDGSKST
jgi:hypothetical protein